MTLDAQIAAALERGDIVTALRLTALSVRSPEYLDGFRQVREIVTKGMGMPDELPKVVNVEHMDGGEDFALEAQTPGHVPAGVIESLREYRRQAKDYIDAYYNAIKAQAEKHGVKPGALRRYVSALETDKAEDAEAEASDLLRLLDA